MTDPVFGGALNPIPGARPAGGASSAPGARPSDGKSFYDVLMNSLDEVNRLQNEASDATQRLMTGEESNPEVVFSAMRKSEVAFNLLMEIRNKLVDAYREIEQMRV
jgi:flagellar hook-basal body complex protein FliE